MNKVTAKSTIKRTYEIKMTNGDIFHTITEARRGVNEPHGVGQDISVLLASKYIIVSEGDYIFPRGISSIKLKSSEVISAEVKSVPKQEPVKK